MSEHHHTIAAMFRHLAEHFTRTGHEELADHLSTAADELAPETPPAPEPAPEPDAAA